MVAITRYFEMHRRLWRPISEDGRVQGLGHKTSAGRRTLNCEETMSKSTGDKKRPCKNCEGKGTLKKGDKIVRCQRCGGTGIKPS